MNLTRINQLLDAHAPHMSDDNEADILHNAYNTKYSYETPDAADFAIRTCKCNLVVDGFDEYFFHLKEMFALEAKTPDTLRKAWDKP